MLYHTKYEQMYKHRGKHNILMLRQAICVYGVKEFDVYGKQKRVPRHRRVLSLRLTPLA